MPNVLTAGLSASEVPLTTAFAKPSRDHSAGYFITESGQFRLLKVHMGIIE
jgi:hypothetical protein